MFPEETRGSPLGGPFSLLIPTLIVAGDPPEWFIEAVRATLASLDNGVEYRMGAPGLWRVLQAHATQPMPDENDGSHE